MPKNKTDGVKDELPILSSLISSCFDAVCALTRSCTVHDSQYAATARLFREYDAKAIPAACFERANWTIHDRMFPPLDRRQ
jgi:hypothetical protein